MQVHISLNEGENNRVDNALIESSSILRSRQKENFIKSEIRCKTTRVFISKMLNAARSEKNSTYRRQKYK